MHSAKNYYLFACRATQRNSIVNGAKYFFFWIVPPSIIIQKNKVENGFHRNSKPEFGASKFNVWSKNTTKWACFTSSFILKG